jgi:hypothetical protein
MMGNRFGDFAGSVWIFNFEDGAAAVKADNRACRQDYSWHFGTSVSVSVPQVESQERTSAPVRCRPFS